MFLVFVLLCILRFVFLCFCVVVFVLFVLLCFLGAYAASVIVQRSGCTFPDKPRFTYRPPVAPKVWLGLDLLGLVAVGDLHALRPQASAD